MANDNDPIKDSDLENEAPDEEIQELMENHDLD